MEQSKCDTLEFTIQLSDLQRIGPSSSLIPQLIREQLSSNPDLDAIVQAIREAMFRAFSNLEDRVVPLLPIRGVCMREISVPVSSPTLNQLEWIQVETQWLPFTDHIRIMLSLPRDTATIES